ncbi:MAG TPA: DUF1330 domain-containing protein [Candidatus Dormibacteraeota bacterium]|nr:DUF1330 domain-containing protein [Candidatus Dormibacteraeota bacterium]
MAAYVIADIDIHDPEGYEDYRTRVPATITAYGGRYLARGGAITPLEGDWEPQRLAVLEFESSEAALAWYRSEEYRPLLAIRQATATSKLVLVEGL